MSADEVVALQVRRATAERLRALAPPGLSEADVLDVALAGLTREDVESCYHEWQKEGVERLARVGRPLRRSGE